MVTKAFFQRYFTASYPVQGLSLVSYYIVLLKWTVAVSDWYYNTELLIIIKKKKKTPFVSYHAIYNLLNGSLSIYNYWIIEIFSQTSIS